MRLLSLACLLWLLACADAGPQAPPLGPLDAQPGDTLTFAAIGDYGEAGRRARAVAKLVTSWDPHIVITLGDNNYPDGLAETIDANVGRYYHRFIAPYRGEYGPGAEVNRFFPIPGNHDWRAPGLEPYLDYFELPGNERYYEFRRGPVHFFALDNDEQEPDGRDAKSLQARWLQAALARSDAPWKVVYMHEPAYSSGPHSEETELRWPYHAWGADVVLAGHDHIYERIERPEGLYLTMGLSGHPHRYPIGRPQEGSEIRFNQAHGALRAEATATSLTFRFVTAQDERVVDSRTLTRSAPLEIAPPASAQPAFPAADAYSK